MSRALDWALGADRLSIGTDGVRFAFERPLPMYIWVAVAASCVIVGVWAYRRVGGPRVVRWSLTGLRASLLFLLAFLLAGPSLEKSNESVEPDWILVLLDRTESMTVADAPGDEPGRHQTRDAQLRHALESAQPSLQRLAEGREIRWFGVGEGAYELNVDETGLPILGEPASRRTSLGKAIGDALQRAAARPLAGMLLVSDGRSADPVARTTLRPLRNADAPLHTVPLGSLGAAFDVAVRSVSSPEVAYKDDPAPITVEFFGVGDGPSRSGQLQLLDELTSEVLVTQTVSVQPGVSQVSLTHVPENEGAQRWRVVFLPDTPDLIMENNSVSLSLDIVDRPVRALYLDGYPRWEQRYLRNLLIREGTVESANLMLAANRRYLQEGDIEVTTLPVSPEEWGNYDVLILGDLDPGVLTIEQLNQIQLFVAEQGGGLVWIAGESDTPRSWWSTPLASLLPFTRPSQSLSTTEAPVQIQPEPESDRLGVLRLAGEGVAGWPAELTDPAVGWSALHWAQQIDQRLLKPTTSVLASAVSITDGTSTPAVLTMRYGAGRVVYVATDETWRWRYGRGEVLYERFWIQLLRLLGRERLIQGDTGFRLSAASDSVNVGDPLPIVLDITDQSLLETATDSFTLRVEASNASLDVSNESEIQLRSDSGKPGRYTAVWTPPAAGRWSIIAKDPQLQTPGSPPAALLIEATLPGGELADPRPDHDLLRSLADNTGGRVIEAGDLSTISDPGVFPSRSVRRLSKEREALWDTPLALMLLLLFAGTEWIGRRIMRVM